MTTSDTNTISSVITRDILPVLSPRFRGLDQRRLLRVARLTTLSFMVLTLIIGIEAERFGGVLGLIILWFAALIGPVSVPMLFGLLPAFRHADARAAIASIVAGVIAFIICYVSGAPQAARVFSPIASSLVVFSTLAWLNRSRPVPPKVADLLRGISSDDGRSAA
jgi:solute:Na+ symporter, SSS family